MGADADMLPRLSEDDMRSRARTGSAPPARAAVRASMEADRGTAGPQAAFERRPVRHRAGARVEDEKVADEQDAGPRKGAGGHTSRGSLTERVRLAKTRGFERYARAQLIGNVQIHFSGRSYLRIE